MSIRTISIFAKSNRAPGSYTSAAVTLPTGITRVNSVRLYMQSANPQGVLQYSDPTETLDIRGQFSLDGGATWQDDFEFTSQGGYLNHQGTPTDPETTVFYDDINRPPAGASYRVIAVEGGTLTFRWGMSADVDVT